MVIYRLLVLGIQDLLSFKEFLYVILYQHVYTGAISVPVDVVDVELVRGALGCPGLVARDDDCLAGDHLDAVRVRHQAGADFGSFRVEGDADVGLHLGRGDAHVVWSSGGSRRCRARS